MCRHRAHPAGRRQSGDGITIFHDVEAGTSTTVSSFSSEASSLAGKYVCLTARYQENGSLVAVRIWVSSDFNKLWLSPEGHVLHVNTSTDTIVVDDAAGVPVPITVSTATRFFFRQPANPAADAAPIGTGTSFLTSHDLVRDGANAIAEFSSAVGALAAGTPVKVYGTPQPDGTYRAYVLMYFAATDPAD